MAVEKPDTEAQDSERRYLSYNGLNTLWAKIKATFSMIGHTHSPSNVVGMGEWLTVYGMAANVTFSSTNYTKLSFSTPTGSGNRTFLTNDDGGIKALKACTVFVFGSFHMGSGYTANDQIHIRVYRNSSATGTDFYDRKVSTSSGCMDCYTIVNLAAGDHLYIYAQNATAARGVVTANSSARITACVIGG